RRHPIANRYRSFIIFAGVNALSWRQRFRTLFITGSQPAWPAHQVILLRNESLPHCFYGRIPRKRRVACSPKLVAVDSNFLVIREIVLMKSKRFSNFNYLCASLTLLLALAPLAFAQDAGADRKSTRLNSSHRTISYAVFCLKKKTT